MFNFLGIASGCAMVQLADIPKRMNGLTEEQKTEVSKGIQDRIVAVFRDAVKALGF